MLTARQWAAVERFNIQRERRIDKLYRIMAVEGDEFSQEKYNAYRARMAGGITMIVLGAASVFGSFIVGSSLFFESFGDHGDCDEGSCGDDDDEYKAKRGAALGMLLGGWASIGIGIPLLITGIMGKNRQNYLRNKDRILAPIQGMRIGLSFDPSTNSGGLSLSATF